MRQLLATGAMGLLSAASISCSKAAPAKAWTGINAANAVSTTDPLAEGQYDFLFESWGAELTDQWPPADFLVSLQASEPDVFGNQFSSFGWIPDPNDDLPIGLKRGSQDPTKVFHTCASCHTGALPNGQLWLGQPNLWLDISNFRNEVNKRWIAAGNPSLMSAGDIMRAPTLGPGRFDAGGTTYAIPALLPPYFALAERTRLDYMGAIRDFRSEGEMSIFAEGVGDPAQMPFIPYPTDAQLDPFFAFFGQMQAPLPPAQDATLVQQGQQIFQTAQCDVCHHVDDVGLDGVVTVPTDPSVPELLPGQNSLYPRGTIRTDPTHMQLAQALTGGGGSDGGSGGGIGQGTINELNFIQEHNISATLTDGYRVSYLHGVWARGPFLHNGSVPTLADLLTPAAQRPVTFMRGSFTVDTTVVGNSNEGHEWGTTLSADDKTALIAYLNSL